MTADPHAGATGKGSIRPAAGPPSAGEVLGDIHRTGEDCRPGRSALPIGRLCPAARFSAGMRGPQPCGQPGLPQAPTARFRLSRTTLRCPGARPDRPTWTHAGGSGRRSRGSQVVADPTSRSREWAWLVTCWARLRHGIRPERARRSFGQPLHYPLRGSDPTVACSTAQTGLQSRRVPKLGMPYCVFANPVRTNTRN